MTNKQAPDRKGMYWNGTDLGLTSGHTKPNIEYVRADIADAARQAGIDEAIAEIEAMGDAWSDGISGDDHPYRCRDYVAAIRALKSEGCK